MKLNPNTKHLVILTICLLSIQLFENLSLPFFVAVFVIANS